MTAMNYVEDVDPKAAQRMLALAQANRIRVHRANVKNGVKAGTVGLVDAFEDELCAGMEVFELLMAVPLYGRGRVRRLMGTLQINRARTVGELTQRQQQLLVDALPAFAFPRAVAA